jgi:glutamate 5-kinase
MNNHNRKGAQWQRMSSVRRVVIKVGTSVVTGGRSEFCLAQMESLVSSIARLKKEGRQLVLVSSGAVGLGAGRLGLDRARLRGIAMRQACAAIGQNLLMHAYEQLFSAHDVKIAQVLLTEDDFTDWQRYLNVQRTMEKLLKLGVLPIVNENDTVSTAELDYINLESSQRVFSDNDRLAALVMSKLEAQGLIILTNVDGLLKESPGDSRRHAAGARNVEILPLVTEITAELKQLASGHSASGRGGMSTKLDAAEIAMRTGGRAVIANGLMPDVLDRIFADENVGTLFVPSARLGGKRRWIVYAAGVRGRLVVNAGARDAIIERKASLLASGVVRVENSFESLDVVSIIDQEGREFARGMANCASHEAKALVGSRVTAGQKNRAQVLVTRNNIVLLNR